VNDVETTHGPCVFRCSCPDASVLASPTILSTGFVRAALVLFTGTSNKHTEDSLPGASAHKRAWKGADENWHSKVEWHALIAWNGLGEYAAGKLKKGDHLYVEGTLVSSVYEKEVGKGKNKVNVPITAWQVKAETIRKLNRAKTVPRQT